MESPDISKQEQKALSQANALHFADQEEEQKQEREDYTTAAAAAAVIIIGAENNADPDTLLLADHLTTRAVHISTNKWPSNKRIGKELKKKFSRNSIHGVEIRILPESHFLKGETGLFASNAFEQFSILGEYCGQICKPNEQGGEYVAEVVPRRNRAMHRATDNSHTSMSLDAQNFGNECRTINHFQNIAEEANVIMQFAYVDELPRLMIVCKKDIKIGEEILLNYGKGYVEAFLSGPPKSKPEVFAVAWAELAGGETAASLSGSIGDY